jgi:hypothetical protein
VRRIAEKYKAYQRANREVCVDFDGTLAQWAYPDLGPPTPDSHEAMRRLQEMGYRIIVWTSRMSPQVYTREERDDTFYKIKNWLDIYSMPYDEIDRGDTGKRLSAMWIDDKAIQYTGCWDKVIERATLMKEQEDERLERTRQAYSSRG